MIFAALLRVNDCIYFILMTIIIIRSHALLDAQLRAAVATCPI